MTGEARSLPEQLARSHQGWGKIAERATRCCPHKGLAPSGKSATFEEFIFEIFATIRSMTVFLQNSPLNTEYREI
jgi:hypothetical protein